MQQARKGIHQRIAQKMTRTMTSCAQGRPKSWRSSQKTWKAWRRLLSHSCNRWRRMTPTMYQTPTHWKESLTSNLRMVHSNSNSRRSKTRSNRRLQSCSSSRMAPAGSSWTSRKSYSGIANPQWIYSATQLSSKRASKSSGSMGLKSNGGTIVVVTHKAQVAGYHTHMW